MPDLIEDIKTKRAEIEEQKTEKARLEGQYDSLKKRLTDEFDLDSIEDAETECEKLEKTIKSLSDELKDDEKELVALMEE